MESPSLSRSLVNKDFEDWCAKVARSDDFIQAFKLAKEIHTPQEWVDQLLVAASLNWSLLPFLTWDTYNPTWVKVGPTETKGMLFLRYSYGQIRIYFKEKSSARAEHPATMELEVRRYRYCRSKRWRSPKDCHQAQQAYYMLKYGS